MSAQAWRRLLAPAAAVAILGVLAGLSACGGGSRGSASSARTGSRGSATSAGTGSRGGAIPAVGRQASPPRNAAVLTIGASASSRTIPAGFLGLSLEYPAVEAYAGTNPSTLNPVFVQLIRNLAPGQAPVLRIGGDSTDWTWWPVPGMARPAGVNFTLGPRLVAILHSLAATLSARLILGVNLEADNRPVADAEAKALVAGIGRNHVLGVELGNEPELYGVFTWGRSGRKGRAPGYDFAGFNQDVTRIGGALTMAPLAGPATGATRWFPDLATFPSRNRRVAVATLHRYPLQLCYVNPSEPNYPTIAHLLSAASSRGLADSVASEVKVAHAHGIPLRIDEMNTNSCGTDDGVSQSFASALWALDALFEMARVGVDGVNIHTYPRAVYQLFTFSRAHGIWRADVAPEYYGLLMFARAAPPGARLLRVVSANAGHVQAWATRAQDGTLRVVAINEGGGARTVAVRLASPASGAGTLERLQAPRLTSHSGVRVGGQSFGSSTTTGLLAGRQSSSSVAAQGGMYMFNVPAGTAAMLTIPAG